MRILVINGPNMHLLGSREPEVYGSETLASLEKAVADFAKELGIETRFAQSNHEGEIVELIGTARKDADAIVINPAAYTHTSVAIHDAIKAFPKPVIEVHMSNIQAREGFRRESLTAPACVGQICGFGANGYKLAVQAIHYMLSQKA
ncbi:MAG: type II 3-dehydroquinate dehydratase [Victivallales bacterium]|nr:type II 3-dehydroquinate dehydratase [Victivallales bacterium]